LMDNINDRRRRIILAAYAQGSSAPAELGVFQGVSTNDDDILAHLDSLLLLSDNDFYQRVAS